MPPRFPAHPSALAKAGEAQEISDAGTLCGQVRELGEKAKDLLAQAEKAGDLRAALVAVREARGCLELQGKVTGELKTSQELNVNFSLVSVLEQVEERRRAMRAAEEKTIEHEDEAGGS